jgi:hypothetical protein
LLFAGAACSSQAAEPSAEALEFFEKRIRPILVEHCYQCHSAASKELGGGLQVDSREALLAGGDSGAAIIPGDPDKSLLLVAVRQTDKDLRMPPEGKLTDAQLADLAAWVKSGAADPRPRVARMAAKTAPKYGMSLEEGRKFWSFQPVSDPPVPAVRNQAWLQTPLDAFILARLEQQEVTPSPSADKRTLLRRVTIDLTGLPPTPAEMEAFLADDAAQAFEKVVDRLLASPRYGERWGRHWLDVVRYADTCGNASDYPVPQAHKYRDWVIRAFNRDLPYDQFLREQIAGDLLPSSSEAERYDHIIATGYLAIARRFGGSRNGEHHLTIEDTIENLGRAVLASSIACARCHDHKFDPFTMGDYYGLYGIFSSTRYPFPGAEVGRRQEDFVPLLPQAELDALLKAHREQVTAAEGELKKLQAEEAELKKAPDSPEKMKRLEELTKAIPEAKKQQEQVVAAAPAIPRAYAVAEAAPANAKLHLRGDPKRLGAEVPRHFPEILGGYEVPADTSASGRLQLAGWLTDPKNPLTARVMVNRIWQYHFGKGLVATPNDFGRQGRTPTHPELLDYLATRFIESGWSLKKMHKTILLSHTWQLASLDVPESAARDPGNELFGRYERRRLDAESLRDALLFVSGELDESPAGPHPFPPEHTWNWTQHGPFFANYETRRRSIYLMQQRLKKNPYLALFDGADPSSSTGVRLPSTTPLQALFLMNGSLAHSAAESFAKRVLAADSQEPARIAQAYQLAYARPPEADEARECAEFLQAYREKLLAGKTPADKVEMGVWGALARVLLSSNEFVYVD